MNHFEVIDYIHGAKLWGEKAGLDNMRALLGKLSDPQRALKCVHVAGTNGKGSLCALIERALRENGLKTGMFTSPYLARYQERIRVGGAPIPDGELARIGSRVIAQVEALRGEGIAPTVFEMGTAIALCYFAEQAVDIAVMEVGVGGRLDPTNVIVPCVTAIAAIGLDHMKALGDTLPQIAREKAGIAKPGVPMVLAPAPEDVRRAVGEVCARVGAPVWDMAGVEIVKVREDACGGVQGFSVRALGRTAGAGVDGLLGQAGCAGGVEPCGEPEQPGAGGVVPCDGQEQPGADTFWHQLYIDEPLVEIALRGHHQRVAAAQALCVLEILRAQGFPLDRGRCLAGLKAARWPGRLEMIPGAPPILLDGAHNPQGANMLADYVGRAFQGRRVALVCAISRDKQVDEIVAALSRACACAVASPVDNPRVLPPEELARRFEARGVSCAVAGSIQEALSRAREAAGGEGLVLVAGSLYLIGEVRPRLVPEDSGAL